MELNSKGVSVYHVRKKLLVVSIDLSHFKYGVAILKWLGKVFKTDVFEKISRDVQEDMEQKKLVYSSPFHICENCFTEIDVRSGNCAYIDNTWLHNKCPELKEGRPV